MTWWVNATTAQRLAQIDGGIELGMTARQIAMASGCDNKRSLESFSNYHGRAFGHKGGKAKPALRAAKAAYFRGVARPDPETSDLHDIMGEA